MQINCIPYIENAQAQMVIGQNLGEAPVKLQQRKPKRQVFSQEWKRGLSKISILTRRALNVRQMVLILTVIMQIKISLGQPCYTFQYPVLFGGNRGHTRYYSIDMDSSGNAALAGSSTDPHIIDKRLGVSSMVPVVVVMDQAEFYRWGAGFMSTVYQRVVDVKFNPSENKVLVAFDTQNAKKVAFALLDSSDGSILQFKVDNSGSSTVNEGFYKVSLIDSSDNLYFVSSAPSTGQAELFKVSSPYSSPAFSITYANTNNPLSALTFGASESEIYYGGYVYESAQSSYYLIHAKIDDSGAFIWHSAEDEGSSSGYPVPIILAFTPGFLLECAQFDGTNTIQIGIFELADPALPSYSYYELQDGDYVLSECIQMTPKTTDEAQLLIRQTSSGSEINYYYIELNYDTGVTLVMNRLDSYVDQELFDYFLSGSTLFLVGGVNMIEDGLGKFPTFGTTFYRALFMRYNPTDPNEQTCLDIASYVTAKAISFSSTSRAALTPIGGAPTYSSRAFSFSDVTGYSIHDIELYHQIDNSWCSTSPVDFVVSNIPTSTYYIGQPTSLVTYTPPYITGTCDDPTPIFFSTSTEHHWGIPESMTRIDFVNGEIDLYTTTCTAPLTYTLYMYASIFTGQSVHKNYYVLIRWDCPIASITASGDVTNTYAISDPMEQIPLGMTIPDDFCDNCDIVISCDYKDGSPLDTSVFTLGSDLVDPFIEVSTSDSTKHGLHHLECTGQIESAHASVTIEVYVTLQDCEFSTLTTITPPDQQYYIFQDAFTTSFTEWYTSLSDCEPYLDYTIQNAGPEPIPFLSIDSSNRELTAYSNDINDEGVYTIMLTGSYRSLTGSDTFTYSILNPCPFARLSYIQIPDQLYNLFSGELVISIPAFTSTLTSPINAVIDSSFCGATIFSLDVCVGLLSSVTPFVTVDSSSEQIIIESSDLDSRGTHCLCVNGEQAGYPLSFTQNCFNLEVTGSCSNPTPPSDFAGSYIVGSSTTAFEVPEFIPELPECVFTYQAHLSNGEELDSEWIVFDDEKMLLLVQSNDNTLVDVYSIEIRPFILSTMLDVSPLTFFLTVRPNECLNVAIKSPSQLADQKYLVGDSPLYITLNSFSQDPYYCDFIFWYTAQLSNGRNLPSFITFTQTSGMLAFEIFSTFGLHADFYSIEIIAALNDTEATPFSLIWNLEVNAKPFLQNPLQDQEVMAGSNITYVIPSPIEPQGALPLDFTIDYGGTSFVFFDQDLPGFMIVVPKDQGSIWYELSLKMKNQIELESEKYTFTLLVKPYVETGVINEAQNYSSTGNMSTAILAGGSLSYSCSVGYDGLLVIQFDQQVVIPENWKELGEENITIEIHAGDDEDKTTQNFTWEVVRFGPRSLEIQLLFEVPLDISPSLSV